VNLDGKRVLITGGSRGIGKAIARACAAAGAHVVLVARNEVLVKEVATSLGGTALACDLSDREQVRGLIARVEADGGPIDVLVNNAGLDSIGALEDISEEALADVLHVNLLAPLELARQIIPSMVQRRSGHIVNVSSYAAATMFPGGVAYAATKAGLSHATEVLRWELKGTGVDLTIVELGPIPTDMLDQVKNHRPTEAGFDRAYKLRLLHDVPTEKVAAHVVEAITKRKRAVRLPIEARLFPLLRVAPQRLLRVISAGIPNR
jgi:short-subunit dehydrogenase